MAVRRTDVRDRGQVKRHGVRTGGEVLPGFDLIC